MVSTWTLVWTTGAAVWEAVQRCPPAVIVAATSRVVPAITLHHLDLRGGRNGASEVGPRPPGPTGDPTTV